IRDRRLLDQSIELDILGEVGRQARVVADVKYAVHGRLSQITIHDQYRCSKLSEGDRYITCCGCLSLAWSTAGHKDDLWRASGSGEQHGRSQRTIGLGGCRTTIERHQLGGL